MAILKLIPIGKIIQFVLRKLRGITPEQWNLGITMVRNAALAFPESGRGAERRAWVLKQITATDMPEAAARALIELAVGYLAKK